MKKAKQDDNAKEKGARHSRIERTERVIMLLTIYGKIMGRESKIL